MKANGSMLQDDLPIKNRLIAVGLNPAWQKTLYFQEFIPGEVNRALTVSLFPAGKGINFARAAGIWGCKALVCQFLGGMTGTLISRELKKEGIGSLSVQTNSPVRVCTTCLCGKTGGMTELIEPSEDVPASIVKSLKDQIVKKIPHCSGIALCGTYPGGVGPAFYADIATCARRNRKMVLLDGYKGVEKTLEAGIHVLKVNKAEFCNLTGCKDLRQAAALYFRRYDASLAAITDGPSKAYLFGRECSYEFNIPDCGKILNPIGAGDTVSAILLTELVKGTCPPDAFQLALGAGTASCFKLKSADFSPKKARDFAKKIKIRRIQLPSLFA